MKKEYDKTFTVPPKTVIFSNIAAVFNLDENIRRNAFGIINPRRGTGNQKTHGTVQAMFFSGNGKVRVYNEIYDTIRPHNNRGRSKNDRRFLGSAEIRKNQ